MEARRILEASSSGPFIVVAREQTAGRGRQGKSFFSPKNSAGSVLSGQTEGKSTFMTKEFVKKLSMRIYDSVIRHLAPSYDPIADYKERSIVLGHDVTFYENEVAHSAHAVDIDEAGGLVVKLADTNELKTLTSGEISLRVCE